jgi:hypothetical protein
MSEDLISSFNVSDVNKDLLKKNSRLALILLIFSALYILFESKYWFDIFSSGNKFINSEHALYIYRIAPAISFTEMVIGIVIAFVYYNAWKNQTAAVESEDVLLFNKAIKLFNTGLILNCVYFLLGFLTMFLQSLYYK